MTELFHELADNAPVMIWRSSTDQMCDYFNRPWLEFTGRNLAQELGIGWVDGVHIEDVERCLTTYRGAFEERKEFSMEYRLRRFDGAYRWVLDNGKPFDREGSFAGYFGSCIDIHERKEIEAANALMVSELNHRVRNNLASIKGLINQTSKTAETTDGMTRILNFRVEGLALAHTVLAQHGWQPVSLMALIGHIADLPDVRARFFVTGEDALIAPEKVESVAVTLHELTLNARQHGALSNESGQVFIDLTRFGEEGELHLSWKEEGGPIVSEPQRSGLGIRMIRLFAGQLPSNLDFRPQGLFCILTLPIKA
jgi:PAS domain S-box-containing protein